MPEILKRNDRMTPNLMAKIDSKIYLWNENCMLALKILKLLQSLTWR